MVQGYYEGIIQSSSSPDQQYCYSISSLADPLIALQAGDTVSVTVSWYNIDYYMLYLNRFSLKLAY